MFLRGPLASRLPVAILRLRGSSAPSTSTSTPLFSTSNHAQSRCHNHAIPTSVPQLARHFGASLVWFRGGNDENFSGVARAWTEYINNNKSNKGGEDPIEKRANFLIMLLAIQFFILLPLFVALIWQTWKRSLDRIPANAVQVDLNTFLEKYLRTGQVEKITCVSFLDKAIGRLHWGAIIDGKPVDSEYVVVKYGSVRFCEVKRNVESKMGISPSQAVPIESFAPFLRPLSALVLCCFAVLVLFVSLTLSPLGKQAKCLARNRIFTKIVNAARNSRK